MKCSVYSIALLIIALHSRRSNANVSIRRPSFTVTGKGSSTEKPTAALSFSSSASLTEQSIDAAAANNDVEQTTTTMKPWTIISSVVVPSILVMTRRCMNVISSINPEQVIQEVLEVTTRVVNSVCTTILHHNHESIAMMFVVVAASRVFYNVSTRSQQRELAQKQPQNMQDPLFHVAASVGSSTPISFGGVHKTMTVLKTLSRVLPELAMVAASMRMVITTPVIVTTSSHANVVTTATTTILNGRAPRSLHHRGDFSQLYGSVPVLLEVESS